LIGGAVAYIVLETTENERPSGEPKMKIESVLISGAGIAGPALAWWLLRRGIRVTVVERAASLRDGGQAVDFRGAVHMSVIERMGILAELRKRETRMGGQSFLDDRGQVVARLPASFMSGDLEIARGGLVRVLFEATEDRAEYLFGDSIATLHDRPDRVDVHFERAAPRSFDLVVGADGLHSVVRALAFGPDEQFLRFCGHYVAGFTAPNLLGLDREGVIYSQPGRGVSLSSSGASDPARATFVFRSPPLAYDRRDVAEQKALVAKTFTRDGWEVPRLLEALAAAKDLYFDEIACADLPRYSSGRIALLGDAAYGGTIGGQGTGLAVVGAYVLAGELAAAEDHAVAFRRYEARVRPYATKCQRGVKHVGPFYAPATHAHRWMRNQMYGLLASPPLERVLLALTTRAARGTELESYAM
jgi:2-polyprenyl-6-methoxyphenol hydroxylase-like FAD-dependent oxidoreductase